MKNILLILFAVIVLSGCSKDEVVEQSQINSLNSVLLKKAIRVKSDGSEQLFAEYKYDGNKIKEISFPGESTTFIYTGELITKSIKTNGDNGFFQSLYEYDSDQKLSVWKLLDTDSKLVFYTKYTHNSDGTVIAELYNKEILTEDNLLEKVKYYFNSKGDVSKEERFKKNELTEIIISTFDDKNSVFKNIIGYSKILSSPIVSTTNNCLTYKRYNSKNELIDNLEYKYEYNENGYPISLSLGSYKVKYYY